jgi:hypothetical protein
MRTQFLYVGLLSMMAGGLVSAGCDDIHSGQSSDPSGPVKLARIMIQDSTNCGATGAFVDPVSGLSPNGTLTDLLDTKGSPLSFATVCDDINPCLPQFTIGGSNPDFSCTGGFCNDPIEPLPTGVPVPQGFCGVPGEFAGTQIRFVFNKLLNSSFETVTIDSTKLPGADKTYMVAAGIVDLVGPDGMSVPSRVVWDPGGSSTLTSDPIFHQFGSALVIKPLVVLTGGVTYTLKLDSTKITDRKGNPMADQNGNLVSGTYTKTFTTAPVGLSLPITYYVQGAPQDVVNGASLLPNEVLQLYFNSGIDYTKTTCTVTGPAGAVNVEWWSDMGDTPTMADCAANFNDQALDIFPIQTAGTPLPGGWPAGDYTVHCTGVDDSYGTSMFDISGTFSVSGTADPMSEFDIGIHVMPEMCV